MVFVILEIEADDQIKITRKQKLLIYLWNRIFKKANGLENWLRAWGGPAVSRYLSHGPLNNPTSGGFIQRFLY